MQAIYSDKILSEDISDNGIVSRIYKGVSKSKSNNNNN